jgi:DNA sulfur modification protein DndB
MFSDLNKNAVKPTKSLNILYDHRDKFSKFIVDLTSSVDIFKDRVELEKTTISNRSTKAFTLNGISDATLHLFGITKTRKLTKDEEETAKEFWNLVSKYIPEWNLLVEGKIASADLRKEFVHGNTNTLNALGIVGRILIREYPEEWKEKIKELRNINWSRTNSQWEGRLLLNGRMLKNAIGVELAANTILENCGVQLPEDRVKQEKKNG